MLVHELQTRDLITGASLQELPQSGHLILISGKNQFAHSLCRNSSFITVLIEPATPLHTQLCFQCSGCVVDTGVDDSAVPP